MGMFDNITVSQKFKLPIDREQQQLIDKHVGKTKVWRRRFQTKSLENLLDYYDIDEHGVLWVLPDKGSREKTDLTTTVQFYDFITNDKLGTDLRIEFEALIISGQVTHMKLVDFEAQDNSARITAQSKWEQEAAKAEMRRKKFTWKMYNWLYATHVNWLLHRLYRFGQYLSDRSLNSWRRRLLFWD